MESPVNHSLQPTLVSIINLSHLFYKVVRKPHRRVLLKITADVSFSYHAKGRALDTTKK